MSEHPVEDAKVETYLNHWIEAHREEMVGVLQELIQIPSVLEEAGEGQPFGTFIAQALDRTLEIGKQMGFSVRNYDGYAGTIRLDGPGKEIGILSHLDVVPAGDPAVWEHPPFAGVVKDGKIYGRGSLDDKGPLVAALFAMKAVMDSGAPIQNAVCHIIGTDEETAHRGLTYYLEKQKAPWGGFSPDANFPVIHGEKGILRFSVEGEWKPEEQAAVILEELQGGTVPNAVPSQARAVFRCGEEGENCLRNVYEQIAGRNGMSLKKEGNCWVLTAEGVGAHAMQPWEGDNAIQKLLPVLKKLELGEAGQWLQAIHCLFGQGWIGEGVGISCQDQLSGPLTINLGTIYVKEGKGTCGLDIRYPIHVDGKRLWNTICTNCQEYGLKAQMGRQRDPLYVPEKSSLVQTLLGVYNRCMDTAEKPMVIGGGTYCRDVANFVSFGPVFPGGKELAHERNEYMEVEQLIQCAKIYAQAIYQLAK